MSNKTFDYEVRGSPQRITLKSKLKKGFRFCNYLLMPQDGIRSSMSSILLGNISNYRYTIFVTVLKIISIFSKIIPSVDSPQGMHPHSL